ncbi:hypothetical protein [Luteimonas sp. FCS-9]|nr:hypothetical protein [Luteimonas sp. FCS-9]
MPHALIVQGNVVGHEGHAGGASSRSGTHRRGTCRLARRVDPATV